ncbi:50S ribosomal protein L6 [candidate division WOR-3 bacterium]|nr:50S ribosomal protein L6 [candidate division WOR-3 bacterium]
MSRIGKKPVLIPDKVTVTIEGNIVSVKGPKGELEQKIPRGIEVKLEDNQMVFTPVLNLKNINAYWGLARALINNMVIGVTEGFKKVLEVRGREYKIRLQGENLVLDLGYSHNIEVAPKEGIEFVVDENRIIVKGYDKVVVGQQAAEIRKLRPPEVYKGKGIRYEGEYVIQKEGKKGL